MHPKESRTVSLEKGLFISFVHSSMICFSFMIAGSVVHRNCSSFYKSSDGRSLLVTCNVEVSHCWSRTQLGSVGVLSTLKTKLTLYYSTEMPVQSLLCVLLSLNGLW